MKKTIVFCDNSLYMLMNFRSEIINSFVERGWKVIIIVPHEERNKEIQKRLSPKIKLHTLNFNPTGLNPINDYKYYRTLRAIYKKEKPDIIFHYTIKPNIYGTLAAKANSIRSVILLAGLGYMFEGDSTIKKFGRRLYKHAMHKADKVIVLNKANRDQMLNEKYVDHSKLIHFPAGEGVSLKSYPYEEMNFDTTRFLMIARILYDKGYQEYVDAAKIVKAKYPDVKIELLGPLAPQSPMGVPYSVIQKDMNDGYIDYLGVTDDVTRYLKKDGTVMVVPSKYLEGLNRSLMEACAMGRPVITTDIPGCKETIDHGKNGFLVPPSNAEALAKAMIDFIELPKEKKKEMAKASYLRAVELFDIRQVVDHYWTIVNHLVK